MSFRLQGLFSALLILSLLVGVSVAQGGNLDSCLKNSGLGPEASQRVKPILEGIERYYQSAPPAEQQRIKSQMSRVLKRATNGPTADKVVKCVVQK